MSVFEVCDERENYKLDVAAITSATLASSGQVSASLGNPASGHDSASGSAGSIVPPAFGMGALLSGGGVFSQSATRGDLEFMSAANVLLAKTENKVPI